MVRAHSELLLAGPNDLSGADTETRLRFLAEGAARLDLLVDGIAGYSIAMQTASDSFQPVALDSVVRWALRKLEKELLSASAEVSYGELPIVTGNADRLLQVMENLLRNALVHRGSQSPRIRIGADRTGDTWRLTVSDNGPGLEADSLESIFLPFQRSSTGKRLGTGLGLASCRAIVERHGGRIWAECEPGTGAIFHFTLPLET